MAAATTGLSYLTVQDMLWTHLQITKQPHDFRFADLEEATYYQYGYGKSVDLFGQAARFLQGFAKKAPFGKADAATGFIGFVAFLAINGYDLNLPDGEAAAWVGRVRGATSAPKKPSRSWPSTLMSTRPKSPMR